MPLSAFGSRLVLFPKERSRVVMIINSRDRGGKS
jgi:hypothetical protein